MANDLPPIEFKDPPPELGPASKKKTDEAPTSRLYVSPNDRRPFSAPLTEPYGSTAKDIGLSSLSGIAEGASGILGLVPQMIGSGQGLVERGQAWAQGRPLPEVHAERAKSYVVPEETAKAIGEAYGPEAWYQAQPFRHQATTLPGQYAHTIASFLPALLSPGSRAREAPEVIQTLADLGRKYGQKAIDATKDFLKYAAAPGAASETAGQLTAGTPYEPWMRGAAAVGTGGVAALISRPGAAERVVMGAAGGRVTPEQMQQAEQLFQDARAQGIPMTRATAVQHVTQGATNLGNIQRYVEGTGGLSDFYSQLPEGVQRYGERAFGELGAPNLRPSSIGPDVMSTARQAMEESPEGQLLSENVWRSGPPTTAEQAGNVIQPELAGVEARREGMRSALADQDFAAARNAPPTVPVNEGLRTAPYVEHYQPAEPPPVGRGAKGRFERKSEQQLAIERLDIPQPVGTMKRDPNTGRMVRKTPDEIEAEQAANEQARQAAMEARNRQLIRPIGQNEKPIVGMGPTHYVQVDPTPAAALLDRAAAAAKGDTKPYMTRARELLNDESGNLDTSVAGMQRAREELNNIIGSAKTAGHGEAVSQLLNVRDLFDKVLERVPAQAEAMQGFRAASRPLDPFAVDRAPGQIVERREGTPSHVYGPGSPPPEFAMRPEQVPGAVTGRGPTGLREFQSVATPAAREAYEHNFVTEVLNHAGRQGADVNSKTIRQAITQNEDLLRQMPGVRDKLESIAIAREGLERVMSSPLGQLSKNPDVGHAMDVLFKRNPSAQSEGEIAEALGAVKERSPQVAKDLVNHYLQTRFNQYTRDLQTGANQYGGAGFAAGVRGSAQQKKNLDAAMRVAYGDKVTDGWNQFADMMEATGARQRVGSPTAFFQEIRHELENPHAFGSAAVEAAFTGSAAHAGGLPAALFGVLKMGDRAQRAFSQWSRGKRLDRITDLLTNPTAGKEFEKLALAPPGSQRAANIASRLAIIADIGSRKTGPPEE